MFRSPSGMASNVGVRTRPSSFGPVTSDVRFGRVAAAGDGLADKRGASSASSTSPSRDNEGVRVATIEAIPSSVSPLHARLVHNATTKKHAPAEHAPPTAPSRNHASRRRPPLRLARWSMRVVALASRGSADGARGGCVVLASLHPPTPLRPARERLARSVLDQCSDSRARADRRRTEFVLSTCTVLSYLRDTIVVGLLVLLIRVLVLRS